MQQDAQQVAGAGMTLSTGGQERLQQLRRVPALAGARETSLERLASAAEEVKLSQGQTLLRGRVMETHAFLLLEGTLRLLGQDPVLNELFTVGRVQPGELVGVIDLLRQAPAKRQCSAMPAAEPATRTDFGSGAWTIQDYYKACNQPSEPLRGGCRTKQRFEKR